MSCFRKLPVTIGEERKSGLAKELKTMDLILLGLGAIVGTGIFVITGTASATTAGPALILSFIIAAFSCALSALCFAEFASRMPVSGGAYSYGYAIFGEVIGWIVGWLMLCQYLLACASVASGWSGYLNGFLDGLGIGLPQAFRASYDLANRTYVDLIAVVITLLVSYLVMQGAKKALRLNSVMVYVKFGLIALFLIVGVFYVKPANWTPFAPFGMSGIIEGAAIVFFAFLGFDAVSTAAEETKDPQKSMPRAIIGSLGIATVLYILVTLVLTGVVPVAHLDVRDPVSFAMRFIGQDFVAGIISIGAILTLLTVLISMMYGLGRLIFAISRDGLLPKSLSKIDEKSHTPKNATIVAGVVTAILSGVIPLGKLAELTNIVTLMVFVIMAAGIIKLRKDHGEPKKGEFRVPLVPVLPILSILVCVYLMIQLSGMIWLLFVIWTVLGLGIYMVYGYSHSKMNNKNR